MPDWIYCGCEPPVGAVGTQSLLRDCQAIWCMPPGFRPWPGVPQPRDRLWLVWRRESATHTVLLLGGGRILQAPRDLYGTNLLWTAPDAPGLRTAASLLGYGGGNGMSFLCLGGVALPTARRPLQNLVGINNRLNVATAAQIAALIRLLPIV